jgi:hypothetical protein
MLQKAKWFKQEGDHILWIWKDGKFCIMSLLGQREQLVCHAHENWGILECVVPIAIVKAILVARDANTCATICFKMYDV